MKSYFLIISLFWVSISNGQVLDNFSGHWTGHENLDSPSMNYDNRNISIIISEGGDREGYFTYTSSCDFLYNEDLSWSYHYFGFNKDTGQIAFLRRFITPLGLLGYEELVYEIIDWSADFFVAEYISNDGITFHQLRVSLNYLDLQEPLPSKVEISKNFPNPFNPSTSLIVSTKNKSEGSLIIYDLMGKEVRTLFDGTFYRGKTKIVWNGLDNQGFQVGGGTYICQLLINGAHVNSQKITLMK
tara:strand:+ start:82 stop:810 length:729 start_codon:yes stop_codon:yes gene_type:complete